MAGPSCLKVGLWSQWICAIWTFCIMWQIVLSSPHARHCSASCFLCNLSMVICFIQISWAPSAKLESLFQGTYQKHFWLKSEGDWCKTTWIGLFSSLVTTTSIPGQDSYTCTGYNKLVVGRISGNVGTRWPWGYIISWRKWSITCWFKMQLTVYLNIYWG